MRRIPLTMGVDVEISAEGQIVIPKDVRDALGIGPGAMLALSYEGRRIVLHAPEPERERITLEEFRRRVPRYDGPRIPIERLGWSFDVDDLDQ